MDDLCREVSTSITKVKDVPKESAVRMYCEQAGQTWNLQVRGPIRLGNGREGKDFIVATARLSVEDLLVLRGAINEALEP